MSKYEPLVKHLRGLADTAWRATFADIEAILGCSLPPSARKFPAWWSNNAQGSRHALVWLTEGWRTEDLDLSTERVSFRRIDVGQVRKQVITETTAAASRTTAGARSHSLELRLGMAWRLLGRVGIDNGKLVFPAVSSGPAIYCFLLTFADA